MSVAAAFERFRTTARYHGWRASLWLLALGLVRRVVTFERVLLYELAGFAADQRCPGPDRVRLATADEVKTLIREPGLKLGKLSEARVDQLYGAGHRCALNLSDGQVVGYSWLGLDDIEIPQVGLALELFAHEGYIYKGFTHPASRGRGVADERYLFWMQHLLERGRSSAVAYFSFDNLATLTRVRKLRMRWLGSVTLLGVGPFRYLRLAGDLRRRRRRPLPA